MEERKVNPAKGRPDNVLEVVIPVHPDAKRNGIRTQEPGLPLAKAKELLKD